MKRREIDGKGYRLFLYTSELNAKGRRQFFSVPRITSLCLPVLHREAPITQGNSDASIRNRRTA